MVLHGSFSWPIIDLQDLNNSRASSAWELFCTGVNSFGLPLRIRCDHGLENTVYLGLSGIDRPGLIRWSVRNQRTERLCTALTELCHSTLVTLSPTYREWEHIGFNSDELFLFCLSSKGSRNNYRFSPQGRQTLIQQWQWRGVPDSGGAGGLTTGNIFARISEDSPLSKWL